MMSSGALALCNFEGANFLLFGPNVAPLVYYSHLPTIIISLVFAVFIFFQNKKALPNQVLFYTILAFVIWVLGDSIFWASNRSDVVMFVWSVVILIEPIVYAGTLYLFHLLVDEKDVSFKTKLIWFLLWMPLAIIVPTKYTLTGIDLSTCLADETIFSYYSYVIELIFVFWLLFFAAKRYKNAKSEEKKKIFFLTAGSMLFLVAFSWGNIIGSFTDNWQLAQYGLFGLPIFTVFLVYSIVKYKTFNIKLIGAVTLVLALIALSISLMFVNDPSVFQGVGAVTSLLSISFGFMLIRSVKKEVALREDIEILARDLEHTNARLETLLHYVGHEVKGFLTKDIAAFSSLSDGDLGEIPEAAKTFINQALAQSRGGARSVTDLLTASNLKKGTVTFAKESFDFAMLVKEAVEKERPIAELKGLSLTVTIDDASAPYTAIGDREKLGDNVLRNVIDNAIKYTPTGSIEISLKKENGNLVLAVKDTGVGITEEDKANLFTEGGHGKDSQKINVHSTGYGLFIAKQIVEAHGGTIVAISDGEGKGSTFIIELPAA